MSEYPNGAAFPFRFSSSGGVKRASGADKVKSNLKALVLTKARERLIRKNLGTIGYSLVLRSGPGENVGIIEDVIREAVVTYEPRALAVEVSVFSRENQDKSLSTVARISYVFKNTGDPVTMSLELE